MLPQFTEEALASAEAWQLPVEVASDITAGEDVDPGEHLVEKQRAQQPHNCCGVTAGPVRDVADRLGVDLRAGSTFASDHISFLAVGSRPATSAGRRSGTGRSLHPTTNPWFRPVVFCCLCGAGAFGDTLGEARYDESPGE